MGLGCYKWYQSKISGDMPAKMLGPQGVDCEIPRWLERKTKHSLQGNSQWLGPLGEFGLLPMVSKPDIGRSANKDGEPQRGWMVRSHIRRRGEENETFLIKEWKLLPSRRALKALRRNPKGKVQRGQYRLAMDLGCYKCFQSQDTGQCACQQGRWPPMGWIVRSPISWRGERSIPYKGVKTSP